jgi:hypothetical protein
VAKNEPAFHLVQPLYVDGRAKRGDGETGHAKSSITAKNDAEHSIQFICRMNIAIAVDDNLDQWYAETPYPELEIGLRRAKPRIEVNPS